MYVGLLNLKKVILKGNDNYSCMVECLFCRILRGEVESKKVYEDENNIAILDINPRMHECQVLVIPRTHVKQFYELSDEENASLFKAVKEVAIMINKAYNPDFVSLFSRGMGVPHAHILVSPAWRNDIILTGFMLNRINIFFNAGVSPQALDTIAEKLKNAKST
jgi:histidine triad (HIT) family protein